MRMLNSKNSIIFCSEFVRKKNSGQLWIGDYMGRYGCGNIPESSTV